VLDGAVLEAVAVAELLPEPLAVVPAVVVAPGEAPFEVPVWVAPLDAPLEGCAVPEVLAVELSVPVALHPVGVVDDEPVELLGLLDEEPAELLVMLDEELLVSVDGVLDVTVAHELDPAVDALSVPVVEPAVAPPETGPMVAPPPVLEPDLLCSLCLTVRTGETALGTAGDLSGGATVASAAAMATGIDACDELLAGSASDPLGGIPG
jgi:hypothetical protein